MNTKIIRLEKKNKVVILLGVMHIGSKHYYREIQSILRQSEHVVYEGIKDMKYKLDYEKLAKLAGLEAQKNVIKYSDLWKHSDINNYQLSHIFNDKKIKKALSELDSIFNKNQDELLKNYLQKIIRFLIKIIIPVSSVKCNDPVVYIRNYKPILDTLSALEFNNTVTVFYGQKHIKQMTSVFKGIGFKVTMVKKMNPFEE